MKKTLILLLTISLLLCGCQKGGTAPEITEPSAAATEPTVAVTEPTQEEPTEEPAPVYIQQPMVAVSMPISTEYITDGDTTVYYYTYQDIYLNVQDQKIADAIIIDYLNRRDQSHAISESLAMDAENAFNGSENWNPHFFESVYSPTRADQSVLSLYGRNVYYSGGNHPQLECMAANYNMVTGEVLTIGSILRNADAIAPLCKLVTEQMAAQQDSLSGYVYVTDGFLVVVHSFLHKNQSGGPGGPRGVIQRDSAAISPVSSRPGNPVWRSAS